MAKCSRASSSSSTQQRSLTTTVVAERMACSLASASDPSPLQKFCVATKDYVELVNGKLCSDLKDAKADDFFFSGLDKSRDTTNRHGSNVTAVNVDNLAGLNTLGISVARIDFAPYGLNLPNTHPCATEQLESWSDHDSQRSLWHNPPINSYVLTKAFQVDKNVINYLEQQFK
ncbi:Germin-like protein subfamily 1 member 14 [Morella rubra]|uniref:Germin-like protein subfamily 1 member 14 n=1 Tax=Morella rubra TaxID=262757 RepID=A0A6A1V1B1_9ROSI|nr:Germin-like protein subfamily 1 member 14 [Morella rubra]